MTIEEQFEVLRQNGWRWRQLDDEWFEIQTPAQYAGQQFCFGAIMAEAQMIHSPLFGDLAEEARDYPDKLAGHLLDYHSRHNLSQTELAEHLGCAVNRLWEVAHAPVPQRKTLESDIEQIARETSCSVAGLRRVIDEQKRPPLQWLFEGGEP